MEFNEIVAPSIKQLFVQTIENAILSGKLKIGEKLPTERELANQMKISRSIVNLGLNELKQKGFIEINPRQGAVVGDYIKNGNTDILLSIINYNGDKIDKQTFNSLAHFRLINEGEVAYLAAINRTEQNLIDIKKIATELHNTTNIHEFSTKLFDFHHEIFFATGNIIYPLVHNAFRDVCVKITDSLYANYPFSRSLDIIDKLIDAIENKETSLARKSMATLIQDGFDFLAPIYQK